MRQAIRDAIRAALKSATDIASVAAADGGRQMTDEEAGKANAYLEKARELMEKGQAEEKFHSELTAIGDTLGGGDDDKPDAAQAPKSGGVRSKTSVFNIGLNFIESAEYKNMINAVPGGRFSEKSRVQSAPFEVKAPLVTGVSDTSAGALVQNDYRGLQEATYERPLTIRDLVSKGSTSSDTIEYVWVNTVTNNAAPVAEAVTHAAIGSADASSTVDNTEAGLKPTSELSLVRSTTTVKTLAHWIPATKRALADASQIRTLIDSFLRYGLQEELEDQMVAGSGSGENFRGVANTSGIQTLDMGDVGDGTGGAGDLLGYKALRTARRMVSVGGRARPNGIVMNPIDWESYETTVDGQNRFYGNGPFSLGPNTLWGLPVVESEAVPQGTVYVADWRQAVLYDREQASIQVTDSHADFFVRNLVAILAELRAAFVVLRPAAFVKVTGVSEA